MEEKKQNKTEKEAVPALAHVLREPIFVSAEKTSVRGAGRRRRRRKKRKRESEKNKKKERNYRGGTK